MDENPAVYYRVWGVDNIAYGPVELPTLVNWVRDGRVLSDTWIFGEGKGEWARASDLPELKAIFGLRGSASKRPAPGGHVVTPGSLRRIKIFAEMDDRQLASFLEYIEVIKFLPHATVCQKGDHGDSMYLVLEGEVRARVMIDDRESTLTTMTVGECFGELAVLDESPRSADVVSNRESVLLKISAAALKKLFQEAPALAAPFLMGLSRTLTGRVRHLTKRFEDSVHFSRSAKS